MARPTRLSTPLVLTLCCLSFFAGKFFFSLPGLPEGGHGPSIVGNDKTQGEGAQRKQLLEHEGAGAEHLAAAGSAGGSAPEAHSFEEVVEGSGMLQDRPPLESGTSGHTFYTVAPFQLLSWYPRAYLFPKFIDEAQAAHIIKIADRRLSPSALAFKPGDTAENTKDVRTSQGTFVSRREDTDGVLAFVEDKIAAVTGIPVGHGEPFNVLRYENGQHYDSHYDSFAEEEYGPQPSQRIATVLLYLSEPDAGGETVFLLEGKDGLDRMSSINYKACNTGIKIKPRTGDALLFWNVHVNGTIDKHSLHGSCPTSSGLKYTATKWLRNKCFMSDCVDPYGQH